MAEVLGRTAAADELGAGGKISFLPPFANDTNKQLHAQLQELEQQLEGLDLSVEEHTGRIEVMTDHLKSVKQEITYTESRLAMERKEVEGEKHLQIMSEKEAARVATDITRLAAARGELSERCAGLQASIFRGSEKLDQFKLLMNWNQEELEQWALAQRQKEEDNSALEKYRRQDDAKLKELSGVLEKLTLSVASAKRAVEEEVTETQAAQTQLDRAAEDFKALAGERAALVGQWDDALEAMRRRDEAVQILSNKFAANRLSLKQQRAELDAQARFLEGEAANNRELEARLGLAEREVAKAREAHAVEAGRLAELEQQVELLRTALAKAANDLSGQEAGNTGARQQLEKARRRLEEARQRYSAMQQKLEGEASTLGGLEAKVSQLEGLRREGEARLKTLGRDTEELRKEQFRAGQTLFDLRSKEKELTSAIAGGQSQNRNLASRLNQLEGQMGRQQELLYNVEFNLQDMERKVARAQGHRTQDETTKFTERINELTGVLEGVNAEHRLLLDQVKQVEVHLHEAARVKAKLASDATRAESALTALALETETVGRALRAAAGDKERALVEHDVLALQVKRLKAVLGAAADQVYSLEARKAALRLSLEERRAEIDAHRDGLRAELKLLRADCHRLTMDVKERGLAVDRLGAKYDAVASKSRGSDGVDGGEPRSQAYYVIKAAQEREELKRQGDQLDTAITAAERDLAGLGATLGGLQSTNTDFNSSLRSGGPAATRELEDVRSNLDQAYDRLQLLRSEEARTAAELDAAAASSSSRAAEQSSLAATTAELERRAAEAARLAAEQADKEGRARKALEKLQRQLRGGSSRPGSSAGAAAAAPGTSSSGGAGGDVEDVLQRLLGSGTSGGDGGGAAAEEQDVALAELRSSSRQMLMDLKSIVSAAPDAGIVAALEAAGFKLPSGPAAGPGSSSSPGSRTGSPAGSRAGSTAGSLKSYVSAGSAASRASASVKNLSLEPSSSSVGDRRQPRSSAGGLRSSQT